MRAATYVRLSASGLGADAPGLDRQREATERLIRERGWDSVASFQDADTSAFRDVPRPGFTDLRAAVDARELDAVVVWKLDRLFRRLREGAEFLDLCRDRDVALVSVQEGVDTSSPYGAILFAIFASLGEIESETRSARISAWQRQRAERGLPVGGGTRPFGFRAGGIDQEPTEAREIRRAARALLRGKTSLAGIVRDWNGRGVQTPTGGRWNRSTVKRVLLAARTAGLREHHGETFPAVWKEIITPDERLQLLTLFEGRPAPNAGRRYLLTGGLAVCRRCGHRLVARPRDDGRRTYVCARETGGCGGLRVLAAPFEEFVAGEAGREWERRRVARALAEEPEAPNDTALRQQLEADAAALEELARERFVTRTLTAEEFYAARDPLIARIAEAENALARGVRRRTYLADLADLPAPPWETPPGEDPDPDQFEAWREWLLEVVERVEVGPAVRGRNRFDPARVGLRFRSIT